MWNRVEIKETAKRVYHTNFWPCVLAGFLLSIADGSAGSAISSISMNGSEDNLSMGLYPAAIRYIVIGGLIGIVLDIFVLAPLEVGADRFFLFNQLGRGENGVRADLDELGFGFNSNYNNVINVQFFRKLYIFLFTLLLIIPGIVKSYEYRMVPYILCERPDISRKEALEISRQMMDGNKWETFVYDLSFIGWYLLGAVTLGIVDLFITLPYVGSANAELYLTIRAQHDLNAGVPLE